MNKWRILGVCLISAAATYAGLWAAFSMRDKPIPYEIAPLREAPAPIVCLQDPEYKKAQVEKYEALREKLAGMAADDPDRPRLLAEYSEALDGEIPAQWREAYDTEDRSEKALQQRANMIAHIEFALKLYPEITLYGSCIEEIVCLYLFEGKPDLAESAIMRYVEKTPVDKRQALLKDLAGELFCVFGSAGDGGKDLVRKAIVRYGEASDILYEAQIRTAAEESEKREYGKAILLLQKAEKIKLLDESHAELLATCYRTMRCLQYLEPMCRKYAKETPREFRLEELYEQWALSLVDFRKHEQALGVMDELSGLRPESASFCCYIQGDICVNRQDYPRAKAYYLKGFAGPPEDGYTASCESALDVGSQKGWWQWPETKTP